MTIYGIIYICPDCRKAVLKIPSDGIMYRDNVLCSDDGYQMICIIVDSFFVDQQLGIREKSSND